LRNLLRDDKDIVLIEVPFHVDDRHGLQREEELMSDEGDSNGEEVIETLILVGGDDQINSEEKTEIKPQNPEDDFSSSDEDMKDLKG